MARRLALITGGTKGLGAAIAARLAAEGYDLILTYASDTDRASRTARDIEAAHPGSAAVTVQADAGDLAAIETLDVLLSDRGRPLDALVLNAGATHRGSLEELTPEEWSRVFQVNVDAPLFTIQRLVTHLADDASIVFTGSLMGIQPHSMSLAYGVSKAAVHALVKNLVKFLAPYGVRVNAVAPGFVDTEWQLEKPAEIRTSIESKVAAGRFATPAEIAEAYLAILRNPYMNGEVVVVDGGYSYR